MDPILALVGAEIRRLRRARPWTQVEVARRIDMDPNMLGRVERGRQNVTLATLVRIADALEVDLIDLFQTCPRSRR